MSRVSFSPGFSGSSLTIRPLTGFTFTVNITGGTVTSDAAGTTAVTFPQTVNASTTYYSPDNSVLTVSCIWNSVECANGAGSTYAWLPKDGQVATITPEPTRAQGEASDSAAYGVPVVARQIGSAALVASRIDPDYALARRVTTPITVPTGQAGNDVVEPKVLYFPDGCPIGMGGKRYVLAACPYPNSDATFENPSLWVSDDGNTWTVPSGVTNPLFPNGVGGAGYGTNSDVDLILGPDNVWYLFWNQFAPSGGWVVRLSTSTDGVNWTTPTSVISTTAAVTRPTCPVVIYDPVKQLWVMYAIDIVPTTRALIAYTATTPAGPWTLASPTYTWPVTGRSPWHLNAYLVGDQHVLLIDDTADGGSGPGDLYLAVSNDRGATLTVGKQPLLRGNLGGTWDAGIYRSAMVPVQHGDGLAFDLWYGGNTGNAWKLGRTLLTFNRAVGAQRVTTGLNVYYTSPGSTVTTSARVNGDQCATPISFDRAVTLTEIGIEVTATGDATAVYRLALYADDGFGKPGRLIADYGQTAVLTGTGYVSLTISTALSPGQYWIASSVQGVTVTAPTTRHSSFAGTASVGSTTALTLTGNAAGGWRNTGQTGAAADPFNSGAALLTTTAPRVIVKVA